MDYKTNIQLSVRAFVEFLIKSGDIDNRRRVTKEKDAMQEGNRIHRKIQKSMGDLYQAEVTLKNTFVLNDFISKYETLENETESIVLTIEGRADGIVSNMAQCKKMKTEAYWYEEEKGPIEEGSRQLSHWRNSQKEKKQCPLIDEIKGVYRLVNHILEPVPVHLAQAVCYGYLYAMKNNIEEVCVQITYCHIESEEIRHFRRYYTKAQLQQTMNGLLYEYAKWARFTVEHNKKRNETIQALSFPFEYRPGQKKMIAAVYQTIKHEKNIIIQAPTGVGKTLSTTFPAVKAMGEGLAQKIFYLTAKTIARTVAEESFAHMRDVGLFLSSITITAKEKLCILEEMDCNPESCPRAKGHFDRINEAVFDFITNETAGTRDLILEYAQKYQVCPFEFCLDLTWWMDAIICDYNYVFDPNVQLQRYFGEEIKEDYIFLVDEAHNLVDRAREMYSAVLYKEDILQGEKLYKDYPSIRKQLRRINRKLLLFKRDCEEFVVMPDGDGLEELIEQMNQLYRSLQEFPEKYPEVKLSKESNDLFFVVKNFMEVWNQKDEHYKIYTEVVEDGRFMVRLFCVNPARNLGNCIERGRAAVFFSATLLPMNYYKKLLGTKQQDYAMYVDSPFLESNRMLCIGQDLTSRYTQRSMFMYQKIANSMLKAVECHVGNYMAFFPSYQFMEQVVKEIEKSNWNGKLVLQKTAMSEKERELFLEQFQEHIVCNEIQEQTLLACCVIGGSFSEGIDLRGNRLIGVFVVGTGLPLVCTERKILQRHFEEEQENGYNFAYLYPGMNKVLQSAGRLIRTAEDVGIIVLLDNRFLQKEYMQLFPREWKQYCPVTERTIARAVQAFWQEKNSIK